MDMKDIDKIYLQYIKNSCYEPGHFYSPIVLVDDIKENEEEIWKNEIIDGIKGIDLNVDTQINLVKKFYKFYNELPFNEQKTDNLRYFYKNNFYSYTDAIFLYSMIRYLNPKKIIEIGSGFSSALMLDVNEIFFDNSIEFTFIEPFPERLTNLIGKDEKSTIILEKKVQNVPVDIFESLSPNDVLFIDSSHIVKTGSDVHFIINEILPVLQKGVFIHFHDIFYPFEYPKSWVYGGKNWNECYFLKSFLMYNDVFEIKLFSSYLHKHHNFIFKEIPLCYNNFGGNLWLEKIR